MKQDPNHIPCILYGTLLQMMQDKRYYYNGYSPDYSHWTEEGKQAIDEFIKEITPMIHDRYLKELDARAKDMVLKELTKNN